MKKELGSNIWKYFLLLLTNRRNYMPILALYFLTLPNSTAQQIGIYVGAGWIMGFIFEIPSGYMSDTFGHKKTLILAKFFMLISTLLFIFGTSLSYFILGSIFLSFGFAFTSGTAEAFLHNTLISLKREREYADVDGKIRAKVSLVSAGMILVLPFLTNISLIMPIKAYLVFDVVGIFVALSLYLPKVRFRAEDIEGEKILSQLGKFKGTGFYLVSFFFGILGAFVMGLSTYKEPYAQYLGFPIIFIGSIMAFSRVVWFVVGYNLKFLKKIKLQKLMLYEIFLFSGLFIICSQIKSPYLFGFIFSLSLGYYYGRGPLIKEYYLDNFLINRRYKATMISINQLIGRFFEAISIFVLGFAMVLSFSAGFLIAGISMLVILLILYVVMNVSMNL